MMNIIIGVWSGCCASGCSRWCTGRLFKQLVVVVETGAVVESVYRLVSHSGLSDVVEELLLLWHVGERNGDRIELWSGCLRAHLTAGVYRIRVRISRIARR